MKEEDLSGGNKVWTVKLGLAAVIGLIAFLLYLPALSNGFVTWDDPMYIYENYHITSIDMEFFKWAFFKFYASNWHPLTWISHAVDHALWGLNPAGHHATSIILHAINAFLVTILAMKLIEAVSDKPSSSHPPVSSTLHAAPYALPPASHTLAADRYAMIAASVTGLLFGLHPLHVESVAWASERKDILCAFFFLLSLLSYLKYKSNRTYKTYFFSLLFFLLALMSKPMAVTLPVVLLIIDWYPIGRLNSLAELKASITEKLPFFIGSAASSLITMKAQKTAMSGMETIPFLYRIFNISKSLMGYIEKMIFPLELVPLYQIPKEVNMLSFRYLWPIFAVVVLTTIFLAVSRRQRIFMAVWSSYIVMLLPVLGIIQVGAQEMADRYTYLPSIGPFLIAGIGASLISGYMKDKGSAMKALGLTFSLVILLSYSYLTVRQIAIWKDGITLWTYQIKIYGAESEKAYFSGHIPYHNMGAEYFKRGLYDPAIRELTKAINIDHDDFAYIQRGLSYMGKGETTVALKDFDQVISKSPRNSAAYMARGSLFEKMGLYKEAASDFDKAIAIIPDDPESYYNRGTVRARMGLLEDAVSDFSHAIGLTEQPDYYKNRGIVLKKLGRTEEAERDLKKAILLQR